jgi:NH3-dependent NAD+ synthetase
MSQPPRREVPIPILTEVIRNTAGPPTADLEALIAELQTKLASRTFSLADEILRSKFAEMEATLFAQISGRLRQQLPELIDATLREYLDTRHDD